MSSQIIPVSLDYKIENSPYIIEGQVLEAISKQDKLKTTIFTDYTVKVISVSKGNIAQEFIIIRNLGGTIGEKTLQVCPNSHFDIGDTGIYFISKMLDGIYEPSFLGQSEYVGYKLEKNENNKFELKANSSENKNILATITSVSPVNVNAGIGDVITITGTGFGVGPPSGQKVLVTNANNTNSLLTQGNTFNYVSWTDTEIKYKVSSDAASGDIAVGYFSTHIIAPQPLQINYNVRDAVNQAGTNIYPIVLPALVSGGIIFSKNTNFTNNDAINTTKIAMDAWTCNTGIKFSIDTFDTTTNINDTSDGLNVLHFANLGATVLGLTYSTITACSTTGRQYVSDVDLGINSSINFNYTLGRTTATQYDYYTTVLHELGHVRNLGHVGSTTDVMYASISAGEQRRNLNTNNSDGGLWVQNESQTVTICSKPLMTAGTCLNLSNNDFENLTNELEIYPNPVGDKLHINTPEEILNVALFDINGRIINNTLINNTIDFSNISNGVYLIKIVTDKGIINKKIIKN
ncbi:T9SS type A sorting domain-containing protein [Flavobacterium sp.]|uniref:T9SS type A sorting domain-containing protein n=1 Tax=Flavobacterium sp. TaxID=239 RepID=UPI0038FC1E45